MNVTIIYGTIKKASTYNCVQLLLNHFRLNINIEVTEFFLQQYLPCFYPECSSSPVSGNGNCNHFNEVDPILTSLTKTDLIILACPVSSCDITTEMKSFLNYVSYHYMKNKTQCSLLCNKIGLVMSTTAGAGLFHNTKILKRNLNFWGINNIFKFSETIYEIDWRGMNLKSKKQINKKMFKLSNKILDSYYNSHTIKSQIFGKMTSSKIEPMFTNTPCNIIDFSYSKNQTCFHDRNI